MLGNFFGMLRKRRRIDIENDVQNSLPNNTPASTFWDALLRGNTSMGSSNETTSNFNYAQELDSNEVNRYNTFWELQDMDIDPTAFPQAQEHSNNSSATYPSESSMNFDYLHSLHETTTTDIAMDSFSQSSNHSTSSKHFNVIGENSDAGSYGQVDDSKVIDRPFNLNERFVTVLDQLDARVEKFRKDALGLQEKKDFLSMSVDLIKSHDMLQNMSDSEREEINCYIHRVNSRLSTVDLNVRTVRDGAQEDSLCQINALIDLMITIGDPVISRQRCQQYLNSCSSGIHSMDINVPSGSCIEIDIGPVDKQFENALLGCTLDDQKNIKRRLQALMNYLNKQSIRYQPF